jgi:hypothetical protein
LQKHFEVNLGVTFVSVRDISMLYFLIDETLANFIKTKHLAKGKKKTKKKKKTQVQAKITKIQSKIIIYLFIYVASYTFYAFIHHLEKKWK